MPTPPLRTWRRTRSALGRRSSRLGPVEPSAPAAASSWQSPQPASANTCSPRASAPAGASSSPPHPPTTSAPTATATITMSRPTLREYSARATISTTQLGLEERSGGVVRLLVVRLPEAFHEAAEHVADPDHAEQ